MSSLAPSSLAIENLPDRLRPRQASSLLLWTILGFFAIFLLWASLTKLDRTVRGSGRVVASSQLQTISNLEGGVVAEILAHTGDIVRRGQALLRLDPTATGAELGSGEASTFALRAKIARLKAEVLGRTPDYPAATGPVQAEQLDIQRALHAARMAEMAGLSGAASARGAQARQALGEASQAYAGRLSARDARSTERDTVRDLVSRGLEPRLALTQAESAASVAAAEAAAASAGMGRARASIAEAAAAGAQARQDWRARAADELAQAQSELDAKIQAIPALRARYARTTVRAPMSGRVNRVLVTTIGSAVAPGAPLAEISPSDDALVVEARVRPQDIASVRIGQRAKVNVSAYDPSIYGGMDGTVESISPDAIAPERGGEGQESYYLVRVRTAARGIRDQDGRLLPIGTGMTAEVDLLGDKRSVLAYLLTPITRLSERAFRE